MRVDKILDILAAELEADSKLLAGDPNKRTIEQRDDLLHKIVRLQISRGNVNAKTTKEGISRNGIKVGRPRRDLNPESQGKEFLRNLEKVVNKDERKEGKISEEGKLEASEQNRSGDEQVA